MSDATHSAVIGPSRSGKTTAMRALALAARRDGKDVMVLDPNLSDWPASTDGAGKKFITHDAELFYVWAQEARSCVLIIDECAETLAREPRYVWYGTRARHWGHHCIFGAHRWTMLLPNIRGQCDELLCFRQAANEAELLSRDFTDETLRGASILPQYHFLHKLPFQPAKLRTFKL